MKRLRLGLITGILWACFAFLPHILYAASPMTNETQAVIALLKEQNNKISSDLRRIRREITALRADLDNPGIKEIFSGIGYIFGLFGTAALVASRRKPIP